MIVFVAFYIYLYHSPGYFRDNKLMIVSYFSDKICLVVSNAKAYFSMKIRKKYFKMPSVEF